MIFTVESAGVVSLRVSYPALGSHAADASILVEGLYEDVLSQINESQPLVDITPNQNQSEVSRIGLEFPYKRSCNKTVLFRASP